MADLTEIEVVGAYDQDRTDPGACRPIPERDVAAVKGLASREQVRRYLQALTDESLIRINRHIQYRYSADGSLWDVSGHTSVSRVVEPAEAVQPASVRALPEVDAESAADYARGWRPLPPQGNRQYLSNVCRARHLSVLHGEWPSLTAAPGAAVDKRGMQGFCVQAPSSLSPASALGDIRLSSRGAGRGP